MALDRALIRGVKLLLHDVSLPALRQRRPSPHVLFYRQRFISTSQAQQQAQVTQSDISNDSFIPFESKIASPQKLPQAAAWSRNPRVPKEIDQNNDVKLDEDWHAEIELLSPGTDDIQGVAEPSVLHEGKDTSATGAASTERKIPDHTSGALTESPHLELLRKGTPPERNGATSMASKIESGQISDRGMSRLGRKLRRIKAGKHNKMSWIEPEDERQPNEDDVEAKDYNEIANGMEEREEHEIDMEEDDGRAAVLRIIDKMPGPAIEKVTPESPEVRLSREDRRELKRSKKISREIFGSDKNKPNTVATPAGSQQHAKVNSAPRPEWQTQKAALEQKFGDKGWQPNKRLSPDTLDGIRALHASDPLFYSTEVIAKHFSITPEAIRRILKSKWRPSKEEVVERRVRWERRGVKKWQEMADNAGMHPPSKWRALGVKSPRKTESGKPVWGKKSQSERSNERSSGPGHWREMVCEQSSGNEGLSVARRLL